ncbi:PilZ domain-containing protein [Loktanella sp. Alg231-35]|uniref:PilZ domain-containing protein n=1 Tax=Loktanella sp. Alg231-35 TaxID=1922220 RepID=UPI00131F3781|nr:PilZ domain-containing protein [Loktanella sp. Alg231-35]
MQYRPHRYLTEFPVNLRTPIGPQKVTVLDVNTTGARLIGIQGIKRGDKLGINVLSHHVEALVRWVSNDRAGIVFRPQITEDQVDTLRHRRDARHVMRRGAIGFRDAEMR